ncbi:hypothetical protein PHYPSEUDO_004281 [Phytophthora pseudosyringae]|uniref:Crinkler effector protein N-terminal domain-containing protein n=1 Tax=Phytophthora pseudosyringae TaxID=221518 RepID=A0A8T1VNJ8_9STRA|nr:hypothetical protein PHYPSEUDO_004281 [Phytophthora pseudosyringae]
MGGGGEQEASEKQQATVKQRAVAPTHDERTLVCAVRGLRGRVCTVTVSADASIHHLKKLILQENASQLAGVDSTTLDVYSTQDPLQGWARVSQSGDMIARGTLPPPAAYLLPTQRVRLYFHANIPAFDSGVVHVLAVSETPHAIPQQVHGVQVNLPVATTLRDDRPTSAHESFAEEIERYSRVQRALGLFVNWSISGTDFSQQHTYHGVEWLEYRRYRGHSSRVFIGDKSTWRELYVACNEVVEENEGRVVCRYVEGFSRIKGGSTLELEIGT